MKFLYVAEINCAFQKVQLARNAAATEKKKTLSSSGMRKRDSYVQTMFVVFPERSPR
jgi:hypothetical protein